MLGLFFSGRAILHALHRIENNQEITMAALTDLQNADDALKAEVATFLQDVANALQANDPDIEAVVSDINAQVAALQSNDPANQAPANPPADNPPADNPPAAS